MSERSQPRKRAVLFDWNGTLSAMEVLIEMDQHAAKTELGIVLSEEHVRNCFGLPVEDFYPALFGPGKPWQEYSDLVGKYDLDFPRRLVPDALPTLDSLDAADIPFGVITSGPRKDVARYLHQAGLPQDRLCLLHTGEDLEGARAYERPTLGKALGGLASTRGIASNEVLYVGDEPANMRDAVAAGIDFVLVTNGAANREKLLGAGVPPERLLADLSQLPGWLGIAPAT